MYHHAQYVSGQTIGDNPFNSCCPYCKSRLIVTEIEDYWPVSDEQILQAHQETVEGYKDIHNLEDCYLDLRLDTQDIIVRVHYCWTCGWWRLLKQVCICAREWQIWDIQFRCAGILKEMNNPDINLPLEEVRSFLIRNYKHRQTINPRRFEEVVASVFRSLGYATLVTAYSNDGGIDIILQTTDNIEIGVQVKNSKNSIKVDQIREFVGALLLGDIPKGIFVTTSRFQKGVNKLANNAALRGIPIELFDAQRFYDALKIAQVNDLGFKLLPFDMNEKNITFIDYYGWDTPRNSL
jgi:restriction system protein